MAAIRVIKILPCVPFHIDIANLLAKSASLPKHIIVPSATNALPHTTHELRDETHSLDVLTLDNETHASKD